MKLARYFFTVMMIMCSLSSIAQSLKIFKTDGSVHSFILNQTDSMVFDPVSRIIPAISLQFNTISVGYKEEEFDLVASSLQAEYIDVESPIDYNLINSESGCCTYHFHVPSNDTYQRTYKIIFVVTSKTGDTATDTLFVRQESNPSPVEYAYYGVCTGTPESVDDIEGRTGNYGSTRVVLTGNSYTTPALQVSHEQRQNCCWIACPTGWNLTHWYDNLHTDLTTLPDAFIELTDDNPYGTTKQTIGNYTVYRFYLPSAFNNTYTIQINN